MRRPTGQQFDCQKLQIGRKRLKEFLRMLKKKQYQRTHLAKLNSKLEKLYAEG